MVSLMKKEKHRVYCSTTTKTITKKLKDFFTYCINCCVYWLFAYRLDCDWKAIETHISHTHRNK